MYSIISDTGIIFRNFDNKVVAPCVNAQDPDFLDYVNWANQGNQITIYETYPDFVPAN